MNELSTSVGRLQTAVTPQKLTKWFPQRGHSSADLLAGAIIARYGQGTALWQPLSPVLRDRGVWQTAFTHQHQHYDNRIQFRPRLNLVLIQHSPHQPEPDMSDSGIAKSRSVKASQPKRSIITGERQMAALFEHLQRQETTQRKQVRLLTQRLNKQHQTIDMLSRQPSSMITYVTQGDAVQGKRPFVLPVTQATPSKLLPRILRQSKPPLETESPNTSRRATVDEHAPFGMSRMEMGVSDKAITTVDTNHLADQVMQKLENRFQAHRERTGRI